MSIAASPEQPQQQPQPQPQSQPQPLSLPLPLPLHTDYFTVIPPAYSHFSIETPCCSPGPVADDTPSYPDHPLLAQSFTYFDLPSRMASNFMSTQTAAAHAITPSRPRAHPVQNVLHVTNSDDSSSDSNMSLDGARCSRCQRTPSVELDNSGKSNMVPYGLNLWYCSRCAAIVGLNKR